jgi:hypothetical protein
MNEQARGGPGDARPPSFFRPGPRMVAWLGMAALVIVLVGIASGRNNGGRFGPSGETTTAPECAHVGQVVDRPASVPVNLLPPGTTLTSRMTLPENRTLVTGVVPFDFRTAVQFFVTKLPDAGYRLGTGDAEQGEAEALFTGEGISGKWKVNGIPNCPDAVTLALLVSR